MTSYTPVTVSGYNSSPPSDDGSVAVSNKVTWAGIKTKLGDPLNTAIASINSNLITAGAVWDAAVGTSAGLKAAISDETGSGSLVFATGPTLSAPVLGTPASGTLSNCTSLPAAGVTGTAVVQALTLTAAGLVTGGGTLAANRTFTVTGATQADQEAGSSSSVAVTPSVAHQHPSAAKCWIICDNAGGTQASYNITSISDTGTGAVTVTIANDFSSSNYALVGGCLNTAAATVQVNSRSAGSFSSVSVKTDDPTAVADVSGHNWAGFGDL